MALSLAKETRSFSTTDTGRAYFNGRSGKNEYSNSGLHLESMVGIV